MALMLKVGADPELWFRDIKSGNIVSAHDVIPGTKLEPFRVPKGAIQVDGAAAEFNIDPAQDPRTFITNIHQVVTDLRGRAEEKGYELVFDPTVTFEEKYFHSLPEATRELGCNPDFSAWTGEVNPSPDGNSTTMRTASGHIHLGWQDEDVDPFDPIHFDDCVKIIKQMDYYLGLYSLMWDKDTKRRALYGKAGAFRPKPYGAEYRSLSNVWLRSASIQQWIFQTANYGVNALINGKSMFDKYGSFAQDAINNNTEWWKTRGGEKIMYDMDIGAPDWKSCLVAPKPLPILEKKIQEPKKKYAKYIYGNSNISTAVE